MAGFAEASKVPDGIDSGIPKGDMYHIAVNSWSTSNGKLIPLWFKFEGVDGRMQTVRDIKIDYSEDKNYAGLASREFCCRAPIGGIMQQFRLIYYCEVCKWVMMVDGN